MPLHLFNQIAWKNTAESGQRIDAHSIFDHMHCPFQIDRLAEM